MLFRSAHIVEGLLKAIDAIDEVIAIIRGSNDTDIARVRLMERFGFSEIQANAILAMRLRRLTGLEREELEQEYQELIKTITRLRMILSSRANLLVEVRRELLEVRAKYGNARRTEILSETGEFSIEDLIPDETNIVTVSNAGYIKRVPLTLYRKQGRGGQGTTAEASGG